MKRSLLGLLFLFLLSANLFAQKESYNWWMYKRVGLDFNTINPTTGYPSQATGLGSLRGSGEAVASLSTGAGQLSFYTNGDSVFNSTHAPIANGGGLFGGNSTTQMLIVPDPRDNCMAYIFTADVQAGRIPMISRCGGCLSYSVVDMTQNGGLGAVTTKNIILQSLVTEKLTAVRHANGHDVWILAHEWESSRFLAFLLTDQGVNPVPVASTVGVFHGPSSPGSTSGGEATGAMKVSPNGKKLICMAKGAGMELFDFDNATGIVSNPLTFPNTPDDFRVSYIAEFSPDNTKLYVCNTIPSTSVGQLLQFDLSSGNLMGILASKVLVTAASVRTFGGLQLGPDGRIYTTLEVPRFVSVINNPNAAGSACDYDPAAIPIVLDPSEMQAGTGIGSDLITGFPQLTIGPMSCASVVPTALLDFRGTLMDSKVLLSWSTASENDCGYYVIEKSADGVNFTLLETVSLQGNSSAVKSYESSDANPFSGVTYYKLKKMCADAAGFERIISVGTPFSAGLTITPNRLIRGGDLTIRCSGGYGVAAEISIYNLMGQQLYYSRNNLEGQTMVSLGNMLPGQYILEIKTASFVERRKLIVD